MNQRFIKIHKVSHKQTILNFKNFELFLQNFRFAQNLFIVQWVNISAAILDLDLQIRRNPLIVSKVRPIDSHFDHVLIDLGELDAH